MHSVGALKAEPSLPKMQVLNAAVVCLAALTLWSAVVTPMPTESRGRHRTVVHAELRVDSPLTEYPFGRERRPDRHREMYERRVQHMLSGSGSEWQAHELAEDSRISSVKQWYNMSSDQLPISLAASLTGLWLYILKGSLRTSPHGVTRAPGSAELLKIDASSGILSSRIACSSFGNPQRLAVDADENLWIADRDHREVVKMSGVDFRRLLAIGTSEWPAGSRPRFCLPTDVAASSSGFIFVADSTAQQQGDASRRECFAEADGSRLPSRIVRFAANGFYTDHFDLPPGVGSVRMSLDARHDRLFVADVSARRLYVYGAGLRPGGGWTFGSLLGEAALNEKISDLRVHPTENLLYVSTPASERRLSFGLTLNTSRLGGMFVQGRWAPPSQAYGFYSFAGLLVDKDGTAVYAADDDGASTTFWKFTVV